MIAETKHAQRVCVVITVDTEPDDAWTDHLNPSVANVQELLRLQELLDRYGAKATCLVTYRVIQDDRAMGVLQRLVEAGGAEIGAHLHPWENPPFMESGLDVRYATYPHELPLDVFECKLTCLTEAIAQRFGKPTSYRAGRWGFVAEHVRVLEDLGYVVDTSVTPWIDWRGNLGLPRSEHGRGGINYRHAPHHPYRLDYADVSREGDANLVEMPLTTAFTRRVPRFVHRRYGALPTLLQRLLRKSEILRPVWTTPAEECRSDLTKMMATALADSISHINIALHSSELMVGGSPSSRTREHVEEIYKRIELLLKTISLSRACEFTTLTVASRRTQVGRVTKSERSSPRYSLPLANHPEPASALRRHRPRDLVYILSPSYSGSTLLTFLLGTHPSIATIGELKATAMGDIQRYSCSCGVLIGECPFWRRVKLELGRRGINFDLASFGTHFTCASSGAMNRLLRAQVRRAFLERSRALALQVVPGWRRELRRILDRNQAVVEVVSELQGAPVFLDSSKDACRLKYLYEFGAWNVKVLHLIRDGRGTTSSDLRRRHVPMEEAAREWRRTQEECGRLISQLPQGACIRVRYEDLCHDPDGTLDRLLGFLGLELSLAVRDYRSMEHHILGSYMRLRSSGEITLDERWKAALTPDDLRVFDAVAGKLNRKYGYE